MKVEIAFDLSASGSGNWFTLNSATKGVLDNVTYLLAGDVLVDVSDDTRAVSVRRGRSRVLDKFTAGNANVTLDNRSRDYDPTYAASPYYGSIVPRKQVIVSHLGQTIFTGEVADWNFGYSVSGDSTAETSCVDGFATLANQNRTGGTSVSQVTSARVDAVLDELGWPTDARNVSTGTATLAADLVEPETNALSYLQKVELSEPGALYMDKDNHVTFQTRSAINAASSSATFGPGGIPFIGIGVSYGTEEMTNAANVIWLAGTVVGGTVTANDSSSQVSYGVIEQTYETLLSSSAQGTALANWIVANYAQPVYRIDSVTVSMPGLSSAQRLSVLALELADAVTVQWTPNNVGTAMSQIVTIDGIEHDASPADHTVTFVLS